MQLTKLFHYAKKVAQLGPRNSYQVLKDRVQKKRIYELNKRKAIQGIANHEWEMIAHKHEAHKSFSLFFVQFKYRWDAFFPETIVRPLQNNSEIILLADSFVAKTFDLLGSGPMTFTEIPWHEDFRLCMRNPEADCSFDSNAFYQDIVISNGQTADISKDIKVPWELSRCYHFFVLGQAYAQTKNKKYAQAFIEQTSDWIIKNPFMLGPNWVCPMEVSLRAINWLCAFHYFKDASCVSLAFWQQFFCSLYDHFFYLENNWEVYDSRTSNHYLSDLVGYFFLCNVFEPLLGVSEKKTWCYQEILQECEKQVFDDGTDYEGSTAYHGLVTELFYLFAQLCEKNHLTLPKDFKKKLANMFLFLDWCTPQEGKLVTIGDDDSGKVLYSGITPVVENYKVDSHDTTKHFCSFGLSIIKTKRWHVTLRHHVYDKRQPSGHFHNDAGSITLAVDGVPIFVDPGSFLYTPSAFWRNAFRSASVHNTLWLDGIEPVAFDKRLFALDLPDACIDGWCGEQKLGTSHRLYQRFGLEVGRSIECDKKANAIIMTDVWRMFEDDQQGLWGFAKSAWNFTLAPDIDVAQEGDTWTFCKDSKIILSMTCPELTFEVFDGCSSPEYGTKVSTKRLRARSHIIPDKEIMFRFE